MNFYEHQEQARKKTVHLIVLFVLAVAVIILMSTVALTALIYLFKTYSVRLEGYETGRSVWQLAKTAFHWQYLAGITLVISVVVGAASLFRLSQLSAGGRVIAEQLNGRLLNSNAQTFKERQLLNVVEEMALASGIPVPAVYLIDELGINAFAAGYHAADAVIGITTGALTHLDRDELQGVIAHEFSHILNGDMRINLRLVGIIFGILVIAQIGHYIMGGASSSYSSSPSSSSNRNKGFSLSVGLTFLLLGFAGVFFGNLIKAAVSRQREFLADASAVQFTRNKTGIANALKKIGKLSVKGIWQKNDPNEIAHMLFAQGLNFSLLQRWMATHPPLDQRIKRLDPSWVGHGSPTPTGETFESAGLKGISSSTISVENIVKEFEQAGKLTDVQVQRAGQHLTQFHQQYSFLTEQVHEIFGAVSFFYALLLDSNLEIRRQQWQSLKKYQLQQIVNQTSYISQLLEPLALRQQLLLLDIALPVLRTLSDKQYQQVKEQSLRLINIDGKVVLPELFLFKLVEHYCREKISLRTIGLEQGKTAIAQLLSALVNYGYSDNVKASQVFNEVVSKTLKFSLHYHKSQELSSTSLSKSLAQVRQLSPLAKPVFLKACLGVIEHNGIVTDSEQVLIYCLAQIIDCPAPILQAGYVNK